MPSPAELLSLLGLPPRDDRGPLAVCCDFDGTITVHDLSLATLDAFGHPSWRSWEDRWRRGEISSVENMRQQFAQVSATDADLTRLYDAAEVTPGFPALASWCRSRGAPLAVLSDGLDIYIRRVLRRLGLDDVPWAANHAEVSGGRVHLGFPHHNPSCGRCGTCKCSFVQALRGRFDSVAYVGDGHSDRCAVMVSDVVFAKGDLAAICARADRSFVPFQDFHDVIAELSKRFPA
jgi:2,3-diketo-5-methylthio-1-phosphopentane phosphatase